MKRRLVIILLSVSILLNITLFIRINLLSSNDIENGFNDHTDIRHENTLSMMLEQNAGEGDYELETRSSWPTKEDGYIFNSELSKCEMGSSLSWDAENNNVMMSGTTSDKCYVYFDKIETIYSISYPTNICYGLVNFIGVTEAVENNVVSININTNGCICCQMPIVSIPNTISDFSCDDLEINSNYIYIEAFKSPTCTFTMPNEDVTFELIQDIGGFCEPM